MDDTAIPLGLMAADGITVNKTIESLGNLQNLHCLRTTNVRLGHRDSLKFEKRTHWFIE